MVRWQIVWFVWPVSTTPFGWHSKVGWVVFCATRAVPSRRSASTRPALGPSEWQHWEGTPR
eukprot:5283209-Lingulodinium_polyedra.AAC.1